MTQQHGLRQQQTNISSKLMFGLGQAGADWKWTSDTTTTGPDPIVVEADAGLSHADDQDEQVLDQGLAVTELRSDLSDLDDLYEYYSQVLR